jgi:hypothetical protein
MSNFNLFCSEVEAFLKKRYTNTTWFPKFSSFCISCILLLIYINHL